VRDKTFIHGLHPDRPLRLYCGLLSLPRLVPAVVDNYVVGSNDVVVGHVLFLCQRPLATFELRFFHGYLVANQPVFDSCSLTPNLVDCGRHMGTFLS